MNSFFLHINIISKQNFLQTTRNNESYESNESILNNLNNKSDEIDKSYEKHRIRRKREKLRKATKPTKATKATTPTNSHLDYLSTASVPSGIGWDRLRKELWKTLSIEHSETSVFFSSSYILWRRIESRLFYKGTSVSVYTNLARVLAKTRPVSCRCEFVGHSY